MSVDLLKSLEVQTGLCKEELAEAGLRDTYFFAKAIAGYTRLTSIHHESCKFLQSETTNTKGLVQPRSTAKSSVIKARLLQHICANPNVRILTVSKTLKRASGGLMDMRDRILGISAPLLPILYPHIVPQNLRDGTWSSIAFTVPRSKSWDEATVEAAGVGTTKVGFHYDIIFFDDPLAPSKDDVRADDIWFNDEEISKVVGYMQLASTGLLDSAGLRQIYFAGTRYAINDAVAWLRANWKHMEWFDRSIRDENGQIRFPTFWSEKALEQEKRSHGSFFYMSQFENNPIDADNKAFIRRDIQTFIKAPSLREGFTTVTIDPSQGKKESSKSFTAVSVCHTTRSGQVYVLDYKKDYLGANQTIDCALAFAARYNPDILGFESVGYQAVLEPALKEAMRKIQARWKVEAIKRDRDSKNARIMILQPITENHDFYIRDWMDDLLQELDDFPHGSKDLLDTIADHVRLVLKYSGKMQFQLRSKEVADRTIADDMVPAGRNVTCVYMEKGPDGAEGYILLGRVTPDNKLYVTYAEGIGYQDSGWNNYSKLLQGGESTLITTPEVADAFFKNAPFTVKRYKLVSQFPEQTALGRIGSGEVILTEGAQVLTMSASTMGLKALEFMAEHARSHKMKVVMV